jgi:hypothetical protein
VSGFTLSGESTSRKKISPLDEQTVTHETVVRRVSVGSVILELLFGVDEVGRYLELRFGEVPIRDDRDWGYSDYRIDYPIVPPSFGLRAYAGRGMTVVFGFAELGNPWYISCNGQALSCSGPFLVIFDNAPQHECVVTGLLPAPMVLEISDSSAFGGLLD